MPLHTLWAVSALGLAIGFLGGLFGKGGSAIATPLLFWIGLPSMTAVIAPLPATIPSTLAAAWAYRNGGYIDRRTLLWTLIFGIPGALLGAVLTRWIDGRALVLVTDFLIGLIGFRILLFPERSSHAAPKTTHVRCAIIGVGVGLISGLLANSGGFLLAPLFIFVLKMPIKNAFATSLLTASILAVPSTLMHWSLGHVDWTVVFLFGVTSIPFSYLGARMALSLKTPALEKAYALMLIVLGFGLAVRQLR